MIRDLEKVKKMFADADALIKEKPELLTMHIDQIFDELDDGTPEMIHIRWGVMVRAKMTEIKSFCNIDILNFLTSIKEHNLLCEYIGYVLQVEHQISLVELLVNAYEEGVHKEVLPFVESSLKNEKDCCIDKLDTILEIMDSIEDSEKMRLANGYGALVLKTDNEEVIFEKYLKNYSESLECLVGYLVGGLYPSKEMIAKKWLSIFMGEEKSYCKKAGIHLLSRSLNYNTTIFEDYFAVLEQLSENQEYWEQLIGVYIQYIENESNVLYRNKVKERLIRVKDGSLKVKRICVQEIDYRIKRVNEYSEIIEKILEKSFDKDRLILESIDYYVDYMLDENLIKAVDVLYKVYDTNGFGNGDEYLEYLPQASVKMNHKQEELFDIWWNKFLYGNNTDFFLSVEMFRRILSLEKLEKYLCEMDVSKEDALLLLEGIFLFIIEEKKIANLVFTIAACVKDNEFFADYCIENIFVNYPGALVDAAKQHIDNENVYKKALAEYIVKYYDTFDKKIRKGYEDKDFVPSTDRQIVYRKFIARQNKEILKNANEQSFFANLFPSRKMKYGRRIAFLQTHRKGQYNYNVSEYARNTFSAELPKCFINDPMRYVYMRANYLKERGKNAINS